MTNAVEPIDLLQLGFTFNVVFAGEAGVDHALGRAIRGVAHEHRVGLGQFLQARRDVHRVAENRDAGVGVLFQVADHRRPGVEADPQLRPQAMFACEIAAGAAQPLQDRQRRATRPQRRVLERDRRAEDRHDAVAGKALDHAALLAHGFFHQLRQASHQGKGSFLSGFFRESREADHICEQDRDLPAFRFHAVLREATSANVTRGKRAYAKILLEFSARLAAQIRPRARSATWRRHLQDGTTNKKTRSAIDSI